MSKICYVSKRFSQASLEVIASAESIIGEYEDEGFDLTLRQLYYQFVSRALIQNTERDYKRLGSIVNDARLAGLLSWTSIVDRTRNAEQNSHWSSPADILFSAANSYAIDKWKAQRVRPEVWVEKDALVGVIADVCQPLDVTYFSCRGYTSQSEMWAAAMRLNGHARRGQRPVVIHLGDHDPSGIDMTRDIWDRLHLFAPDAGIEVRRIALTREQIEEYNPPPNPAKQTDARYRSYLLEHGDESWELDALDPRMLRELVEGEVEGLRSRDKWEAAARKEKRGRAAIEKLARQQQNGKAKKRWRGGRR